MKLLSDSKAAPRGAAAVDATKNAGFARAPRDAPGALGGDLEDTCFPLDSLGCWSGESGILACWSGESERLAC